ncbi:hypothetical protein OIDMADRAFT_31182 [Oidiodendron maius Zn]|uniref:F-box domain-containing protein n=1 Tax=Oidiodendron maius (strain Zn) TaxID=913774 RepID=A0A0C3H4T5_OIDMZ|nr:hypothetical protein OIDMADRAFT_31182 [Oidiodendron maius Zn]
MSAATFDVVAPEVLQEICRHLDLKSLSAFAITNKQCNSIANIFLLRTIRITLSTRVKLQQDIDHWMRRLDTTSFKYVRRLEVQGCLPPEQDDLAKPSATISARLGNIAEDNGGTDNELMDTEDKDLLMFRWLPDRRCHEDRTWQPVVNFLRRFPALADLVFTSSDQFSPCLLEVLHQNHPNCRLHITFFHYLSSPQRNTDLHDLALASSPSLYSISVFLYEVNGDENSAHDEALSLWWRTYGVAPNLKDIRIFYRFVDDSPSSEAVLDAGMGPLRDSPLLETHQARVWPAKLERLELHRHGLVTLSMLNVLSTYIDFSVLRILKLKDALEDGERDTDEYHFRLEFFLRSLPPLRNLRVSGRFRQNTFDAIVEHHGKSLRQLWLEAIDEIDGFVFNYSRVEKIRQHCLMLEDLTLDPIPRSKGDVREVAIYRKLGEMIKVRKLSLVLDSLNIALMWKGEDKLEDPTLDEFHQQHIFSFKPRRNCSDRVSGYVCDVLINCAVDEILAHAIFDTISGGKSRGSSPPECLKLDSGGCHHIHGPQNMRSNGLWIALVRMSRSWLLERCLRDDCRDKVIAWDIYRQRREATNEFYRRSRLKHSWSFIEPVFRKIWPGRQDSTCDSLDDWYSWPLSDSIDSTS